VSIVLTVLLSLDGRTIASSKELFLPKGCTFQALADIVNTSMLPPGPSFRAFEVKANRMTTSMSLTTPLVDGHVIRFDAVRDEHKGLPKGIKLMQVGPAIVGPYEWLALS
jgi:hypothetical protein